MSLREAWPSLSPRERDAKVAEALGWSVAETMEGENRVIIASSPEHRGQTAIYFDGTVEEWYTATSRGHPELPEYSTSWEHAGPLLDRLKEDGWSAHMQMFQPPALEPCVVTVFKPEGLPRTMYGTGAKLPEAIALVFCLAMEAQP